MRIVTPKGRTVNLVISIESDDGHYLLQTGDTLRFGVRLCSGGNKIISKTLTSSDEVDGTYHLELTPEDTNITPGRYLYDIGLQLADGSFYDIVLPDHFVVKEAVTFKEDT